MAANPNAQKLAELAALVELVKERVRNQYPETTANGPSGAVCVGLPDLTPLARARDAAAGKMAAIGTVNPRRGGIVNNSVQAMKRVIARGLNWFVRDQVLFNRQIITCIEIAIETLNDTNRTIHVLAGQANTEIQKVRTEMEPLRREAHILRTKTSDFDDLVSHWNRWREEWQLKLHKNEVEFLKSVADLNAVLHQKVHHLEVAVERLGPDAVARQLEAACARRIERQFTETVVPMEAGFRQAVANLEESYRTTLQQTDASFRNLANSNAEAIQASVASEIRGLDERMTTSINELQNRFYADLDRIRTEYERVIHAELRVVRQRLAAGTGVPPAPPVTEPAPRIPFDYARFAIRFRGSEEYVSVSQQFYVPYFRGRRHVLDIGCGRGEFLVIMREAGVPAKGIESSEESVAQCRAAGLDAEQADLFAYLSAQPEGTLDGIFCSQVVEHLPPARLPEMIQLCATRLATGGILAIETPNPECLAIFATHFYLDPTHTRPIPSQLLAFYMEESGLGRIEVHPKAQAVESIPELAELPAAFREKFFGGLDYAIIGYRL